jgi:3-oxoadipate enol-lactonase
VTCPLAYRFDGPADAPVLVLGPSLGTRLEMWDAQVRVLARSWRVLRYDLRGHGGSPVLPGPSTVAELAGDVLALLDALGLPEVAYCGISLGGAIGQQLATHQPGRIRTLVLCCTAARFGEPAAWRERAGLVRAAGPEPLLAASARRWFTPSFAASRPDEVARLLGMLRGTPAEGYASCCDALASFDLRGELARIAVPSHVVAGADDPSTPVRMAEELADGIPHAQLTVIPRAAHLANVERPEAVTAAIEAALSPVRAS